MSFLKADKLLTEKHRWMLGLFQVLAHTGDESVVQTAGTAQVIDQCVQLLDAHHLPFGMEVKALVAAGKLVGCTEAATLLQNHIRELVQSDLLHKVGNGDILALQKVADVVASVCPADPQLASNLLKEGACQELQSAYEGRQDLPNMSMVQLAVKSLKRFGGPKATLREMCTVCGMTTGGAVELMWCERCRAALYCGRNCQAKHWPSHKRECKGKADMPQR